MLSNCLKPLLKEIQRIVSDILKFKGKYRWLSNFKPCSVYLDGNFYPSVENAYQAAKTLVLEDRFKFQLCTAKTAKKWGKKLKKRPDWDDVKIKVMEFLLRQKFAPCNFEYYWLKKTGNCLIVEGNTWNDTFWGVCDGVGENNLGKILMKLRGEM